jgi:competence protein ComEC
VYINQTIIRGVKSYLLIYFALFILLTLRIFHFYVTEPEFRNGEIVEAQGEISVVQQSQFGTNKVIVGRYTLTPKNSVELLVGQKIHFSGLIHCPHEQTCHRPWIYKPVVRITALKSNNLLLNTSIEARNTVVRTYSNALKRDQANLISGIVIGNVTLDTNFRNKLAMVGLTHVVAASGMNVTLVAVFVAWVFSSLKIKRTWAFFLSAGILFFYCAITGFAPPIIRALLMCLAVFFGKLVGRKNSGIWSLIWSAYLMLWVDPSLINNVSFLLSFASMVGQIAVSNLNLSVPKFTRPGVEILIQTAAALLSTFPIVMISFSTFSLISMVSNFMVLWTVEPLMLLGGVAGIVGFTAPFLAELVLVPAGVLLDYFLWVVKVLSNDAFLFKFEGFNVWVAIGYYLLLGLGYYYLIHQKKSNI